MDLSTSEARLAIATKWATKYGLSPAVVCAVVEQESGWNPWSVRYEPAFFERYIVPLDLPSHTEATTRATSWGLMQVMGQTARELGFGGKFLSELCDPDIGIDFGCRRLQVAFNKHGGDLELSLLDYNGGGNKEYGNEVTARISRYEVA